MCLYKINYTKQSDNENHIEIVNVSDTTINNLKLLVDLSLSNIAECIVVRERGHLAFTPPINLIELGNLSPNESAHFYYTLQTASPTLEPESNLKQFQLAYDGSETETISSLDIPLCKEE